MKRDDDLIREIVLSSIADTDWCHIIPGNTLSAGGNDRRRGYHVALMMDEGLAASVGKGTFRITSKGQDYGEAIQSPAVWEKTKVGASKIGGATLGMMVDLAKAYLKKEAAEKLGIEL